MPRSSTIWTYFRDEIHDGKTFIRCVLCGQLYKQVDGSTTGARSHLVRKHPDVILGLGVKKKQEEKSQPPSRVDDGSSKSVGNMVAKKRKLADVNVSQTPPRKRNLLKVVLPRSVPMSFVDTQDYCRPLQHNTTERSQTEDNFQGKQHENSTPDSTLVTEAILKIILSENLPFSFANHPSFQQLLHILDPSYKIPDRRDFSTVHLNSAVDKTLQQNRDSLNLNKTPGYSFTSDIWTSKAGNVFVDFHVLYIDQEFKKMHCQLLDVVELTDGQTPNNIIEKFHQVLDVYGIKHTGHEFFMTFDDGSDTETAWEDAQFNRISCIEHFLHSVVQKTVHAVPEVQHAFEYGTNIISHISGVVKKFLHDEINQLPQLLQLVQHDSAQWNTYLFQEEWLQKLQPTIAVMTSAHGDMPVRTDEEWTIAQQCIHLMKPLEQLTKSLNGWHYPTLSARIPMMEKAKRDIVEILNANLQYHEKSFEFGKELLGSIDVFRFSKQNLNTENWSKAATALDPRFKTILFDEAAICVAKCTLNSLHSKIEARCTQMNAVDKNVVQLSYPLSGWDFLEDRKKEEASTPSESATLNAFETELNGFLKEGWIGIDGCPLQWWREHGLRYPLLAKLAQILLAVPASSMPSEHLRSPAGNILVPKPVSIDPTQRKNMLFARAALCRPKEGVPSSRNFPDVSDEEM